MGPDSGWHSRLDLACEPTATRYALGHAKDVLGRWGVPRGVAEDALVIIDELVTNAVRHAGAAVAPYDPGRGRPKVRLCALALWVADDDLHISVYDQSSRRPVLREVSLDAEDGRGLQLVSGLSEGNWGYALLSPLPGKVIWARLPIAHPTGLVSAPHPDRPSAFTRGDRHQRAAQQSIFGEPERWRP